MWCSLSKMKVTFMSRYTFSKLSVKTETITDNRQSIKMR